MILWLASYPRSGNTLARMILHAGSGVPTYSMHRDRESSLDMARVARLIGHKELPKPRKEVTHHKKLSVLIDLARSRTLSIIKTHRRAERVKHHPTIYIVRDGRDVVVSLAYFMWERDRERYGDRLGEVLRGDTNWGRWGSEVLKWRSREAPTAFVHYEDMIRTPYKSIQKALDYLGIDLILTPVPLEPFGRLHAISPDFFRTGKVGGWRQEMSPKLHELFWKLHEGGMAAYGYTKS